VLAHVQQNVRKSVPNFARSPQQPQVVAPEQRRAFPPEDPVDRSREARCHGLHPARQRLLAVGLHDHVQMISLD
jgi:hypothetical protein